MLERIINHLKKYEGYISGEELSHSLNISRAGIWKYIQELRRQGYDIVAVPHLGYQLVGVPDKLYSTEIKFKLKTKKLGQHVVYFNTVGSTMDEAFRLGMEGAPEGTLVCAENQTKGRGRLGRTWFSPKGKGVYLSLILRPKLSPIKVPKLTLLCAVSVCEALRNISGLPIVIKWPNDLLVNNKKLVGILTELSAEMDQVRFVNVGLGVNVNATASHLPEAATSLKIETHKQFSRVEVIQEILRRTEHWYHLFQSDGFKPVINRWKEFSMTLGKHICISDPGEKMEGKAIDIDQDGGLLIRGDSGVVVKKMTGDVVEIY